MEMSEVLAICFIAAEIFYSMLALDSQRQLLPTMLSGRLKIQRARLQSSSESPKMLLQVDMYCAGLVFHQ